MLNIGSIGFTQGVDHLISGDTSLLLPIIKRHINGDWGNVPQEDKEANDFELSGACGGGFLSSYQVNGERVWISTVGYGTEEVCTTIMLPEEY